MEDYLDCVEFSKSFMDYTQIKGNHTKKIWLLIYNNSLLIRSMSGFIEWIKV
jgi:hypothetical protein